MKTTAIYVRRSVSDVDKGNNSLSIAAQKEECIRFLGEGADYKIYCDDGKSGKDIEHRPAFQEMMTDVRNGEISRIIVKKYDRFSRNMREYLNITDILDKLGISVISLSEPFNTETKEGKMMRNNLLNFAEFERNTISARVADAYDTKARETGFYQGGKVYFGYKSDRQTINGKTGSVLVPSDKAVAITAAYEVYKEPSNSLSDVISRLREIFIGNEDFNIDSSQISRLLESPLYVRADKEVYRYLASQGYEMIDDISAYDGVHGLFLHGKFNNKSGKTPFVKVGYHEGLVDAHTWLAVQDKKSHTAKFKGKKKALNSWLVGLVKCAICGRAFTITYRSNVDGTKEWRYYRDRGYATAKSCVRLTPHIRPEDVENAVFEAMKERLKTLEIAKHEAAKPNPEIDALDAEIIRIEDEINDLMNKLPKANETLFEYINKRVDELDKHKSELEQKRQSQMRKRKAVDTKPLDEPLKRWHELSTQEKRNVAGKIIEVVRVSDETGIDITFSI